MEWYANVLVSSVLQHRDSLLHLEIMHFGKYHCETKQVLEYFKASLWYLQILPLLQYNGDE